MPYLSANALSSLAGFGLLLLLPPLRNWFESTMFLHMLLHIPAFVLVGYLLGTYLENRYPAIVQALRPLRWALLLCATFSLGIWMIPRLLDLAAESFWVDCIKAVTLIFSGGLALKLAWHHAGPVARGLIHIEAMASLLRLGWVYVESPTRLCTRYGQSDQYVLGQTLLIIGGVYALVMAWRGLNGYPKPLYSEVR